MYRAWCPLLVLVMADFANCRLPQAFRQTKSVSHIPDTGWPCRTELQIDAQGDYVYVGCFGYEAGL